MSRNETRNGEDEIEKAKAIGEFYGTSECSKSISSEKKKPFYSRKALDPTFPAAKPPSIPPPPNGEDLFKIRAETNCRTVVPSPLSVRC